MELATISYEDLRDVILRWISSLVSHFVESATSKAGAEILVTVLVTPADQCSRPIVSMEKIDTWLHVTWSVWDPCSLATVEVFGPPRLNPLAKASSWLRERTPLEDRKSLKATEVVLLSESEGSLLEGLVTNFFVALKDGAVQTANENVLFGAMRDIVLRVCLEDGIPVHLSAPKKQDMDQWAGAFITNVNRPVMAVSEIRIPTAKDQSEQGFPLRSIIIKFEPNALINRLRESVLEEISKLATPLLRQIDG